MAKRPSAPSTRSKQHQALRYIYSTDLKTAARDYNVSTSKLRQFVLGNPRRESFRVAKDPELRRIYRTDVKEVAQEHKVKLIPRLTRKRYFELQKREDLPKKYQSAIDYRTATRVRRYKKSKTGKVTYPPLSERERQTIVTRRTLATRDLGGFSTKNAVKQGYADGLLTRSQVNQIIRLWAEKYHKEEDQDEFIEEMQEELMEDIDENEGEE